MQRENCKTEGFKAAVVKPVSYITVATCTSDIWETQNYGRMQRMYKIKCTLLCSCYLLYVLPKKEQFSTPVLRQARIYL